MTIAQDAGKQGEAEGLKDTAQNKASQISSTSDKDALGESSLDDVSGGAWTAPLKPQSSLRLSDLRVFSVTGLAIAEPLR